MEFITSLLRKFESCLEGCLGCRACLTGIMAALESTVAEAKRMSAGLIEGDCRGLAAASRDFALSGSLKALMPWEKIHV